MLFTKLYKAEDLTCIFTVHLEVLVRGHLKFFQIILELLEKSEITPQLHGIVIEC